MNNAEWFFVIAIVIMAGALGYLIGDVNGIHKQQSLFCELKGMKYFNDRGDYYCLELNDDGTFERHEIIKFEDKIIMEEKK